MITYKLIFISLFLFVSGMKSFGQYLDSQNAKLHVNQISNRYYSELKLNSEQVQQIQKIEESFFNELLIPERDSGQIAIRKIKINQLQNKKEESIKRVLTAEQWLMYVSKLEKQRDIHNTERQERKRKKIQEARIN